ncbi:MAG: hypothetical protein ACJ77K_08505 [Bacteroidia bacterium]
MLRAFAIFILLSVGLCSLGQTNCENNFPDSLKKYDNYSAKKLGKLKHSRKLSPEAAFDIATYFRSKNDSTALSWYALAIEMTKRTLQHRRAKAPMADFIYRVALCYYFRADYTQAYLWFIKAVKASYHSECLDYFLSAAELKAKLSKEAATDSSIHGK